jgi:hypothetical protein
MRESIKPAEANFICYLKIAHAFPAETCNAWVIRYFRQSLPKVQAFQLSAKIGENIGLQLRYRARYVTRAISSLA